MSTSETLAEDAVPYELESMAETPQKSEPQYMDNPKACGAPEDWRWGYLPCGCANDGYGRHER